MSPFRPEDLHRLLAEDAHVRRLAQVLAAGHGDDVAQQTWVRVLENGGGGVQSPRPWLARIVANLATNLRRGIGRRRQHEAAAARAEALPSAAELAMREEQRTRLMAAIGRLPDGLRTVVWLRWFEGLPPRRIARRLGVPATTVWNRQRQALAMLRTQLDAEHEGSSAWAVPMLAFARGTAAVPTTGLAVSRFLTGVSWMTLKTKSILAAALAIATLAWLAWPPASRAELTPDPSPPGVDSTVSRSETDAHAQPADVGAGAGQREHAPIPSTTANPEATAPTPSTAGTLRVAMTYAADSAPAADVAIEVRASANDPRRGVRRARTDAAGAATITLPAATYTVCAPRSTLRRRIEVTPGSTTTLDATIAAGITVHGRVVDAHDVPVPNASLQLASVANADTDPSHLGEADAAGHFTIRDLSPYLLIGALAPGYCASNMVLVEGQPGSSLEVVLRLGANGGVVEGTVRGPGGLAVAGVAVLVGATDAVGFRVQDNRAVPPRAIAHSDELGRFRAIGVPAGAQRIFAIGSGFAPWLGDCDVVASGTTEVRIDLAHEATVHGFVIHGGDAPVQRALVRIGAFGAPDGNHTYSAADGSFALAGLSPGPVTVHVQHGTLGEAHVTAAATTEPGSPLTIRLTRGLVLNGRVVDAEAMPIRGAYVEASASGFHAVGETRADGTFVVNNCPPDAEVELTARATGKLVARKQGIDPRLGPVQIEMADAPHADAAVVGRVFDGTGRPLAHAEIVLLARERESAGPGATCHSGDDGRFELGPVAPATWAIRVTAPGQPVFHSAWQSLGAGQHLDLGEVHLPLGGRARLRITGDPSRATFVVLDAADRGAPPLSEENGTLTTTLLVPGNHRLLVRGATAAQSIPFVIRDGATIDVPITLRPGTKQTLRCDAAQRTPPPRGLMLHVRRDGQPITHAFGMLDNGAVELEFTLDPGNYEATAYDGDQPIARAAFTVTAQPQPPVQLR